MQEKNSENIKTTQKRRGKRVFLSLVLFFAVFFLIVGIIGNSHAFQNWYTAKFSDYLSSKTGFSVSMGVSDASIFSGIAISDVIIRDQEDSLLLKSQKIKTSLRKNLFSLIFQNSINLEDISIENAQLSIFKKEGDSLSNLEHFIKGFQTEKDSLSKCKSIDIRNLGLKELSVQWQPNPGYSSHFQLNEGRIFIDHLDLCDRAIEIREIYLNGFDTKLISLPGAGEQQNDLVEHGPTAEISKDSFHFVVKHLLIDNSSLELKNQKRSQSTHNSKIVNFKDIALSNLEMEGRNIYFNNLLEANLSLDHLSFEEKSGFVLKRMSIENIDVSPEKISLSNSVLASAGSTIRNNLTLSFDGYDSFKDFSNKIFINSSFDDCLILPGDLSYFSEKLTSNDFFRENANNLMRLNGNIRGRINNLKGKNIQLQLDQNSFLSGTFSSRNLNIPGEQLMNIRLSSFKTNTLTLGKLFPDVHFSPSFLRMGNLDFKGSFDGYLHDFVAFGKLETSIGSMNMDMRLDLQEDIGLSEYSGNLSLQSFDLGEFTARNDLGNISLSAQVRNGRGLNINTVRADLGANIDSLEFKGHIYRNFVMDGYLDKNIFNGDLSIDEEHIRFDLSGLINYGDSIPKFNFRAKIEHLDLENLNISKNPLVINSHINLDLEGSNMDNLSGDFYAYNINLANAQKEILLDSLIFTSVISEYGERHVDFSSELLSFNFDGKYSLLDIPDALIGLVKSNFPKLAEPINYWKSSPKDSSFYYDFYVHIPDSKNLFNIIQATRFEVNELMLSGHINHSLEVVDVAASIGNISIGELKAKDFDAILYMVDGNGNLVVNTSEFFRNKLGSDSLHFDAKISKGLLSYQVRIDTLDEMLNNISLSAITTPHKKGYETQIVSGSVNFLNDNWYFKNDNSIILGKEYVQLKNFALINNIHSLSLEDMNQNKGIKAIVSGFEIALLNPFLRAESKLKFGGRMDGFFVIPEVFSNPVVEGALRIPDFLVNDDPYGSFTSILALDTLNKNRLNISGSIEESVHSIKFTGHYLFKEKMLSSHYVVKKFPIAFLEYFLGDLISGTRGQATGSVTIGGKLNDLQIEGEGLAENLSTRIDYLGLDISADKQLVKITPRLLDFTGIEILDKKGNKAIVRGGIKHRFFKDLTLDLDINSDRFLALNTTRKDNPSYYGYAEGPVNVNFSGPIEMIDMSINAEVLKSSSLTIPVRYETEVSQQSFIKFRPKEANKHRNIDDVQAQLTGINLDMNVSIQPGAEIKIILDENAGDNIQGKGTGDIRLEITRSGAFEMYGNYFIDEGTYLFTALTLIQKPFSIREGGKISWTGDPLDANIDFMADYTGERVALDNFLKEYTINNPLLAQKARKRTDVDLLLHLSGSLLHPSVTFDLNFPNLDGEIKTYAYSKLQKLKADQNLMYTQAVSLLSLGAFLPQDNLSGLVSNDSGVSTAATGIHTGLQYSAVLLSKYLSGLFDEIFANSSWISGVDIDLNVINSQSIVTGLEEYNIWPNEYTYDAKLHLFEDKASVELSGSYVNRGTISEKSYANGDFIFKYYFTEDRKLRIEAFSKREFDEFQKEWKWKIGTGLNYQLEFGSIYDMKEDLSRDLKEKSESLR